jgi:mycofactocin precursor
MSITETPVETTEADLADAETTVSSNSDEMVVEELLVEEVSIDGMCGVY